MSMNAHGQTIDEITVIVITYNSGHCIETLSKGLISFPNIIVVDNASTDNTLSQCAKHLPQAQCIASAKNLGFGAANNVALARVQTPYALLLNPDCEITADAIASLISQARIFSEAAIIVPQIIGDKGKPTINYGWLKHMWKSKGSSTEGPICVAYASGAVMLLNMSNTKPLGFFDERFFLYYEDDDICLKYFNAHRAIIVIPDVKASHTSRGSVKTKRRFQQEYWRAYHHAQSKLLFTEKYQGHTQTRNLRIRKTIEALFATIGCTLILNFKLTARMLGRVKGLLAYKSPL